MIKELDSINLSPFRWKIFQYLTETTGKRVLLAALTVTPGQPENLNKILDAKTTDRSNQKTINQILTANVGRRLSPSDLWPLIRFSLEPVFGVDILVSF
jgi:hypothetical protein